MLEIQRTFFGQHFQSGRVWVDQVMGSANDTVVSCFYGQWRTRQYILYYSGPRVGGEARAVLQKNGETETIGVTRTLFNEMMYSSSFTYFLSS